MCGVEQNKNVDIGELVLKGAARDSATRCEEANEE